MNFSPPHFQLGSGYLSPIPFEIRTIIESEAISRAKSLLDQHELAGPDDDRLRLIVQAALEVRALLFAAALTEPSLEDLDRSFEEFVLCAVTSTAWVQKGATDDNTRDV